MKIILSIYLINSHGVYRWNADRSILTNRYDGLRFKINKSKKLHPYLIYINWDSPPTKQSSIPWIQKLFSATTIGTNRIDSFFYDFNYQINDKRSKVWNKIHHSNGRLHTSIEYSDSGKYSIIQLLCSYTYYRTYLEYKLNCFYDDLTFKVSLSGLFLNKISIYISWE